MTFKELEIVAPIQKALDSKGYTTPTPIQEQAIPILLKGNDLLGCAQTGTGKTAAFAIPIIQQLFNSSNTQKRPKRIKALIVTPTRELAIQIAVACALGVFVVFPTAVWLYFHGSWLSWYS